MDTSEWRSSSIVGHVTVGSTVFHWNNSFCYSTFVARPRELNLLTYLSIDSRKTEYVKILHDRFFPNFTHLTLLIIFVYPATHATKMSLLNYLNDQSAYHAGTCIYFLFYVTY